MPTSRAPRRPWYRLDRLAALDRLREFVANLLRRATTGKSPSCRPELISLEPRVLLSRPLPLPVVYVGAGSGSPDVKAYNAETGELNFTRTVYDSSFTGGVRVAVADFTGDGYPDLVAAPGAGGGPNIRILDGKTGEQIDGPAGSFWAFDPSFTGGVYVAAADVDGDGTPDVIAAAGPGGGPEVRVFSGKDARLLSDFYAYDADFRGGITVAAADLDDDRKAEIAVGAGPGGGPHVRIYHGLTGAPISGPLSSFYAFDQSQSGGVFVGADGLAGDVTGDGIPDLAVGSGPGTAPLVHVYDGKTGELVRAIAPFTSAATGGVRVALAYVDDDDRADIVVGSGPGVTTAVQVYSGATGSQLADPQGAYTPFGDSTAGAYVAASNDPPAVSLSTLANAGEPNTTGAFLITLSAAPGTTITVTYTVTGTATAGVDYQTLSGSQTFTAFQTGREVGVVVIDDDIYEGTETVVLTLNAGTGYTVGSPDSTTVYITDNEFPPPPPPPSPPAPIVITGFADDTGYSASDNLTNDTALVVSGTGPASGSVVVYDYPAGAGAPRQLGSTTADGAGNWSAALTTALAEGPETLYAAATLGGSGGSYRLTVDTTPPQVYLTDIDPNPYSTVPALRSPASDRWGFAPTTTVTLDVDLNGDTDYADAGETGYAAAALAGGAALFAGYTPLPVNQLLYLRTRVTDAAGNQGTSPPISLTIPPSPPLPPGGGLVDGTPDSRSAYGGPAGWSTAMAGLVAAGNVPTSHPLDLDLSPTPFQGQDAALVYNSWEADPNPIVRATLPSSNLLGPPDQVLVTLTWDGAVRASGSPSGLVPGADWAFALQPGAAYADTTGRHTYTLDVFVDYPGTINDVTGLLAGSTFTISRRSGPFGAGWSLAEDDALYAVTATGSYPAGELMAFGRGGWAFFPGSGSPYTSPAGDPGALVAVTAGFEYTAPDGRVEGSAGRPRSYPRPHRPRWPGRGLRHRRAHDPADLGRRRRDGDLHL